MTVRKTIKRWLYGRCPGFAGRFPYFGVQVYFPKGSHSFDAACAQGIFEWENVRILQTFAKPGAVLFDVGANIGLMAVPVLTHNNECRVVSFEPSPHTLPYLQRTVAESPFRDRWSIVPKAVGSRSGHTSFSVSAPAESLYDGIRPTGRAATLQEVKVEMVTLDETWNDLERPEISHIKIDVEGGELDVLHGAKECLAAERPPILLEWNPVNLVAYGRNPGELLDFAAQAGYRVHATPGFTEVLGEQQLALHMAFTESFVLLPAVLK
jgi:FkbM family methyltransferase